MSWNFITWHICQYQGTRLSVYASRVYSFQAKSKIVSTTCPPKYQIGGISSHKRTLCKDKSREVLFHGITWNFITWHMCQLSRNQTERICITCVLVSQTLVTTIVRINLSFYFTIFLAFQSSLRVLRKMHQFHFIILYGN